MKHFLFAIISFFFLIFIGSGPCQWNLHQGGPQTKNSSGGNGSSDDIQTNANYPPKIKAQKLVQDTIDKLAQLSLEDVKTRKTNIDKFTGNSSADIHTTRENIKNSLKNKWRFLKKDDLEKLLLLGYQVDKNHLLDPKAPMSDDEALKSYELYKMSHKLSNLEAAESLLLNDENKVTKPALVKLTQAAAINPQTDTPSSTSLLDRVLNDLSQSPEYADFFGNDTVIDIQTKPKGTLVWDFLGLMGGDIESDIFKTLLKNKVPLVVDDTTKKNDHNKLPDLLSQIAKSNDLYSSYFGDTLVFAANLGGETLTKTIDWLRKNPERLTEAFSALKFFLACMDLNNAKTFYHNLSIIALEQMERPDSNRSFLVDMHDFRDYLTTYPKLTLDAMPDILKHSPAMLALQQDNANELFIKEKLSGSTMRVLAEKIPDELLKAIKTSKLSEPNKNYWINELKLSTT